MYNGCCLCRHYSTLKQVYQERLQSALDKDILQWGPGVTLHVTVMAAPAVVGKVRMASYSPVPAADLSAGLSSFRTA